MIDRVSSQSSPMMLRDTAMSLQRALARANSEVGSGRHADLAETLGSGLSRAAQAHVRAASLDSLHAQDDAAGARVDVLTANLSHLRGLTKDLRDQFVAAAQAPQARVGLIEAAKGFLSTFFDAMNGEVAGVALFGGEKLESPVLQDYASGPSNAIAAAFQATFGGRDVAMITADEMSAFLDGPLADQFSPASWAANWSNATDFGFQSQIAPGETAATTASANEQAFRDMARVAVMAVEIGADNLNDAAFTALATRAASIASAAIDSATVLEARMGVSRRRISDAQVAMSETRDLLMRQIGAMEDVDPAQAATRVNDITARLEATFAITVRMRDLSLLKYL